MNLPRQLEKDGVEAAVAAVLQKDRFAISAETGVTVASLELNDGIRRNLFYARSLGELIIGYEMIEKALAAERRGLAHVGNRSERVSRLLLVTNDGSPRFYRQLTFLQRHEGPRVLICRLNADSLEMAEMLGLPGKSVKAVLVNRKNSVVNLLKALPASSPPAAGKPC
jgi:hypothetical protein